jgi:hypothetical protein
VTSEYAGYINEVEALNLPKFFEGQKRHAASVLGNWVVETPTTGQIDAAQAYFNNPLKKKVGKVIGSVLRTMTTPLVNKLADTVERVDPPLKGQEGIEIPNHGLVSLKVGFSKKSEMVLEEKIRSLKRGTRQRMESESPFNAALFQTNTDYLKELRISHPISWILRSGFDEMPQLGKLDLISARGYLWFELTAIEILAALCDIDRLGFSMEMREAIKNHEPIMLRQGTRPGIINAPSALRLEGPPGLARIFLDCKFAQRANAVIETRIGILAVARRSRQLASVTAALGRKRVRGIKNDLKFGA